MASNDAVLKYLRDQNRPYSANDIFMNLHKEYGKTAVQKSLDYLVEKGKIKEKVYGKQKVYAVLQNDETASENMGKELNELDSQIGQATIELTSVDQELKASEILLRDILSTSTTEEALKEQKQIHERIKNLSAKLDTLSQNVAPVSPQERERIKKEYEKNLKEWRKRKLLCMDIVNSILEGYPKSKKALLEEIGVETDEDVGVAYPKV
ncbi:homologous-pairing protein 2 homolog [Anabrus simplex]|uniref:homologous-pairing protein 2 homolog n=1 Tax=Anabrus simplex TaxID=316456 RepID=UPI0035A37B9D